MKIRGYAVTLYNALGQCDTIDYTDGPSAIIAVKRAVRSIGGGPLTQIDVTPVQGGTIETSKLRNTQLYAVADLIGGTRDQRNVYLVSTKVNWTNR